MSAFGVSAVTHAAILLLVLFVTSHMPPPASSRATQSPPAGAVVWIPLAHGNRGALRPRGGGGSGKADPAPARRAEGIGRDSRTVAVARRSGDAAMTPAAILRVQLDAVPTRSGLTDIPGAIGGVPSGPLSLGPGDGGLAGAGVGPGDGDGRGDGLGDGRRGGEGGGEYEPTGGASYPRLISEVAPTYTIGAMQARVEGTVELSAVVRADGTVGDVRITRSLDRAFGLDQEAVRVVRLWRFVPAFRGGRAVAAVVPIEIRFTIR